MNRRWIMLVIYRYRINIILIELIVEVLSIILAVEYIG